MIDGAEPAVLRESIDATQAQPDHSPDARAPVREDGGKSPASVQPHGPVSASGTPPLVDPTVCRTKFDRVIQDYRSMEDEYLRRGWILVRAEYPEVVVLFAAPQLTPPSVIFGVRLDFTNFDFWPPSVRFVKPFTLEPLTMTEMPTLLLRRSRRADGSWEAQPLLQSQSDRVPFICARGVREYHHHPAHSNDPWLAYRSTGVGTLYHILNLIHRYGIAPMKQYAWQLEITQCKFGFPPPNVLLADVMSLPE